VEAASHAVLHGIASCLAQTPLPPPVEVRVLVKASAGGSITLLDARVAPEDEGVATCVRRLPQALRIAPGEGSADIEIRYDTSAEADGAVVSRSRFFVK
jgi:hypothetical protein